MIIPKKIKLAHLPTPLEKIKFRNKEFLIKRDDYTGSDFLGNKIRKLEYLLYEAKRQKAEIIFTCGGDQSNHARATASAAARIGIKTKLFLWGKDNLSIDGNLFLDKIYGSEIVYLNKNEFSNVDDIMMAERTKLVKKGRRVYVIPAGGSSTLGIWGYISFFDELKKQIDLKNIDGILSACGSGGTAAGLLVGSALNNLKLKILAVNVLHQKEILKKKILQLAEGAILDYKLNCKTCLSGRQVDEKNLRIVDGYSNEGYKNIYKEKLTHIVAFAKSAGILLDPTYTGKAFCAYKELILDKGKGKKVIFLHTGGIFGTFPMRNKYLKNLTK